MHTNRVALPPGRGSVAAVSLIATVGYLAAVFATQGLFGDTLARDVGLAGLVWAVLVESMQE